MERPGSENGRRRRPARDRESVPQRPPRPMLPPPPPIPRRPASNEAKLAAIAVDLNIRLRSADMPCPMQERAFRCGRALLDGDAALGKKPNPSRVAMCLKKEFDQVYGLAWHCIVGKSFGSFVTHSSGGFVYFSVDKFSFLLFKTEVRPVARKSPA